MFVRDMGKRMDPEAPAETYPLFSRTGPAYLTPIYPEYHTALFPDSILRTESPDDFIEQEPHRNAIRKAYISRSWFRDLHCGDVIVFYRTKTPGQSAYYTSVVSTIGIVESVVDDISSAEDFVSLCRKRSVFTNTELRKHWDYKPRRRPFVVNFLYAYSLPKRPNLEQLIELGVVRDTRSVPRGFEQISSNAFAAILEASNADEAVVVD